ncbi:MAG: hypothetical protein ICV64_12570 [Thermoleophilia bacterium]|nr:hypothetical protein [Thermoleophilia bacterium]
MGEQEQPRSTDEPAEAGALDSTEPGDEGSNAASRARRRAESGALDEERDGAQ